MSQKPMKSEFFQLPPVRRLSAEAQLFLMRLLMKSDYAGHMVYDQAMIGTLYENEMNRLGTNFQAQKAAVKRIISELTAYDDYGSVVVIGLMPKYWGDRKHYICIQHMDDMSGDLNRQRHKKPKPLPTGENIIFGNLPQLVTSGTATIAEAVAEFGSSSLKDMEITALHYVEEDTKLPDVKPQEPDEETPFPHEEESEIGQITPEIQPYEPPPADEEFENFTLITPAEMESIMENLPAEPLPHEDDADIDQLTPQAYVYDPTVILQSQDDASMMLETKSFTSAAVNSIISHIKAQSGQTVSPKSVTRALEEMSADPEAVELFLSFSNVDDFPGDSIDSRFRALIRSV